MKIEIEISEQHVAKLVEETIARQFIEKRGDRYYEAIQGVRKGVDEAVKNYIYSEKDNIIERVVERATREIVKKGLPKLLEEIGKSV